MYHPLDAPTLAMLFGRARRGDRVASSAWVRLAGPALEPIIARRLASRTRHFVDWEDIFNETLVFYFQEAEQGDLPSDPGGQVAHLIQLAVRRTASANRFYAARKRPPERTGVRLGEDAARRLASAEPGPEELAMMRDECDWLLAHLTEPGPSILRLTWQGLEPRDVAAKLGISVRTVRWHLHAAKEKLRLRYEQDL
jgi:DNA-directed RNA polymerase specialized sigma24 family protein